jgi:ABC-type amino acid transport substrate-binding protein
VIGTEGTFAPFSYHDDNDNLVGYDVEVSEALAKELGVKVKFVEVKWDSLIAGLDSDKYDLVTNQVAITAERKKKYDFSIPHTYSYPAIITKKDNTEITKMSDIKGHKFSQTGHGLSMTFMHL